MGSGASSPANKRNDQFFFSVGVSSSKSNRSVQNTTVEYSKSLTKPSPRVSAKTHLTPESYDGGIAEKIEPEIIFSGIKLITFEKFKSHGSFPAFDDFSDNHEYFLVPLELINQDRSFIVYISYNWNVDTKPKEIYKLIIEGIQKIQAAYTSNSTKCYLYYDIDAQQNTAYKTVSFRTGDDISNSNNDLIATYNKEVAKSNTTAYFTAGYNRGISGEMSDSVRIRNKSINFVVENSIQAAINNVVTSEKVSYTVANNDPASNSTTLTTATSTATQPTTQNVFNSPQKTPQNSTFNTPNKQNINSNIDNDINKNTNKNTDISVALTPTQAQLHTLISNCDCLFTPIFDAQSSDWTLPHVLTSCTEYGSKSFFNPHNNTNSNSNSINNSYNSSVNNSNNNNHLQILSSVISSNNSNTSNNSNNTTTNNTNNTNTTTTTTALSTKANKIDHSYLSSAYARVEMLYALNIPIKDGSKVKRHLHFTGPLSTHLHHNRRPHFVYGTKESKRFALPIILPPLKNVTLGIEKSVSETVKSSFGDFNPLYGVVESELERMQIEQMVTNILPHIQTYFKTENNESVCDYNHGGYDHNGHYKEILPSNSTSNKY